MAVRATRTSIWLEVSKRRVSSTQSGTRDGSAKGLARWSGWRQPQYQALPSSLVVVSLPATTMRKRKAMISSSVSRSPSISATSRAEVRSSVGCRAPLVDHVLVVADQGEGGLHAGRGHVEQPVLAVDHQVGQPADLGPVDAGHPDQLGDHVHGQLAGEVGDEVERAALEGRLEVLEGDGADPVLHLAPPWTG